MKIPDKIKIGYKTKVLGEPTLVISDTDTTFYSEEYHLGVVAKLEEKIKSLELDNKEISAKKDKRRCVTCLNMEYEDKSYNYKRYLNMKLLAATKALQFYADLWDVTKNYDGEQWYEEKGKMAKKTLEEIE